MSSLMIVRQTNPDLGACLTCGCAVFMKLAEAHEQWHKDIADVAIQNTKRIERLEGNA